MSIRCRLNDSYDTNTGETLLQISFQTGDNSSLNQRQLVRPSKENCENYSVLKFHRNRKNCNLTWWAIFTYKHLALFFFHWTIEGLVLRGIYGQFILALGILKCFFFIQQLEIKQCCHYCKAWIYKPWYRLTTHCCQQHKTTVFNYRTCIERPRGQKKRIIMQKPFKQMQFNEIITLQRSI